MEITSVATEQSGGKNIQDPIMNAPFTLIKFKDFIRNSLRPPNFAHDKLFWAFRISAERIFVITFSVLGGSGTSNHTVF